MEDYKIVRFGSLYLDGVPNMQSRASSIYDGDARPRISLGDSVPDRTITWIERNGKYAALQPILLKASWNDLDACGLAAGTEVTIDGAKYLCRLPRFGADPKVRNEWEEFFLNLSDLDSQVMNDATISLGVETGNGTNYCSARHGAGMGNWRLVAKDTRMPNYAWRPVLEPVACNLETIRNGTLVRVKFLDGSMLLDGNLAGYTNYDLLLTIRGPMPSGGRWYKPVKSGLVAVDRVGILSVTPLSFG